MPRPVYLLLPLAALAAVLTGCPPAPTTAGRAPAFDPADVSYEIIRPDSAAYPASADWPRRPNLEPAHYTPDTLHPELLPERTVRVNFHLMNYTDTLLKYHGDFGRAYAEKMGRAINIRMREAHPPALKDKYGRRVPALPRRIRFVIADDPQTGQPGIYDRYDDEVAGYQHVGKTHNRGDRRIVERYAVRKDSILNIFFMPARRDSLERPGFKSNFMVGVYLGDVIKIGGVVDRDLDTYRHDTNLLHEIGHALGLRHAWTVSDGCDDTPVHRNDCWDRNSKPHCDSMKSNNLMDYSNAQLALTPCQIGRMHARLGDRRSKQRKLLVRDWCTYRPQDRIEIRDSVALLGARDFATDIFVRPGGVLYLNDRVHFASGAGIFVDPGARLELGPRAILHNDCGDYWGGLRRGRAGRYAGKITVRPGAQLVNLRP